jgi:transcriptional regulator with XRE-family HTH domain/quercetin dioxygenase-like cupin family protein
MGKATKRTRSGDRPPIDPRNAPSKESLESIGNHLRAARLERNISLREMARRIDVSPSFVSQVELGKAKPSLGTLYAFLSELELSLDELMPPADPSPAPSAGPVSVPNESNAMPPVAAWPWSTPASPVQRGDSRRMVQLTGVTWQRLTSHDDPLVDFLHVTYEPGAESCPREHLMRHVGVEYGFMTSGSLTVQVGFEFYNLEAGDSISFDSATPHRLSNESEEACTSVWVVVGRRTGLGAGDPAANGDHRPR